MHNEWECDNGHEFELEEMVVERCVVGTHYRCPQCDSTNIREKQVAA